MHTVAKLIRPAKNLLGALRMPGDKSISHRYAMLAGFAAGESVLSNYSTGADCASTLRCVEALGCAVDRTAEGAIRITGKAGHFLQPSNPLDCGNSGSTMRMLSGMLAGQGIECELVGDESLSRRPMSRVVLPLRQMGARIAATNERPPLHISPVSSLNAIKYAPPVASAQVKSAVLFAGMQANGETVYVETVRTRDHTELALRAFGAELSRSKGQISIRGPQSLKGRELSVPGDISSSAFFLCAAALFPESNLLVEDLGMNPTRAVLFDILNQWGAKIRIVNLEERQGELVGTVRLEYGKLRGLTISGTHSAQLIDELPVLAAIAPYTNDGVEIRDAKELRVKESDRISAVVANLRAMGAQVEEIEDGLRVPGGQQLHGAEVDSFGDHRIAMAFAVAALRAEGDTLVRGADATNISFPEFWEMLEAVCQR